MIAVGRDHKPPASLGLQVVLAHDAAKLFAVHNNVLLTMSRTDTAIAIALEPCRRSW